MNIKKSFFVRVIHATLIFLQFTFTFLVYFSRPVSAASPFQQAFVTLGNSRFSFRGAVSTSVTAGSSTLTILSSGYPDNNVGNIFPEDILCFNGAPGVGAGCKNSMDSAASNGNYSVTNNPNVANQVVFFSPAMTGTVNAGDYVVSTQSGVLTASFRPTTPLASGDKVVLIIPAATANYADG
ncbi:MAG: hypothetical protein WA061_05435, partial [Microgenomates group bacterium]